MLIGPQLPRRMNLSYSEKIRARHARLKKLIAIFKLYGFVCGNDLAHALNVSKVTLHRDIISLRAAGCSITSARGYGYQFKGGELSDEVNPYRDPPRSGFKATANERRQQISKFIDARRKTSAHAIAAAFNQDKRTIYRDIAALKAAGIRIAGGERRGYSIEGDA